MPAPTSDNPDSAAIARPACAMRLAKSEARVVLSIGTDAPSELAPSR